MTKRAPDFSDLEARRAASIPRFTFALNTFVRERILEGLDRHGHDRATLGHGVLLRNMDLEGTPLSVIALRAGVSRQAIAKVASDLTRLGYVKTVTSPDDGRVKIVKLTARGIRLVEDSIEIFEEIEAEFEAIIGPTRLETLRRTLGTLCKGLEITKEESGSALGS